MIKISQSILDPTPSNWTRNSVFIHQEASCSSPDQALRIESISSKNMIDGFLSAATVKSALINFSPSPRCFDIKELALMLKNVHLTQPANAFAIIVFPFPGGPYIKMAHGGSQIPLKRSGFIIGSMTAFFIASFTSA